MACCNILRITTVVVICLVAFIVAVNRGESEIGELPFCDPDNLKTQHKLVFVSTLDGRLSALDPSDGGSVNWSINTGRGQMLSSSIHRLELTDNGQFVRMIPSLSGGIYKFNGSSIEPIPVTADQLLKSTPFSFSSNLAISGGRETRTYGVAVRTGELVYECSLDGCSNSTENLAPDDMLLIQRHTQTVRAVEGRTGSERWNFSVGQHELSFISEAMDDCHQKSGTPAELFDDSELKVIVPEGLICSVKKSSGEILWKHKFDAPVVAAWYLLQDQMYPVDLFSGAQWAPTYNDDMAPLTPSLYIGMHNRQLYIQESVTVSKMSELAASSHSHIPQITWAPVSATGLGLVGTLHSDSDRKSTELGRTELMTIAQSILYASEYSNGNGYYLFSTPKLQCDVETGNSTIEEAIEVNTDYSKVENEVFSIWLWWKEVFIIGISTAIVVNLVVTRGFLYVSHLLRLMKREVAEQEIIVVEKPVLMLPQLEPQNTFRSHSDPGGQHSSQFTSRFLTDFYPVHCLGKGGFGVVFEARNKIDDCNYAIKRIPLPNRQESRDRVMREVKALAKLEHSNIVRYFNAWLECPPPGWQEEQDKLVPNCNAFCSLGDPASTDLTSQSGGAAVLRHLSSDVSAKEDKCFSVFLNVGCEDDSGSYSHSQQIPRYNSDKSDSFIVFEKSAGQESEHAVDDDCDSDHSWDDGLDITKSNTRADADVVSCTISDASSKCLSAWSEEIGRKRTFSINECHEAKKKIGHRRPLSLDISSGGRVMMPPPKISRMYLFIQMQLCRRESLREWLRDTCVRNTNVILPLFNQIVQAVEYVHLQGLIHRDLKPSNIFFSLDGQIKVGDFGLVTAMVENNSRLSTPSSDLPCTQYPDDRHTAHVGTHLYMSPEQAQSLPYNYKVDIYSLGVILFELLIPFGTDMERSCTLMDVRNNKFPAHFQQQFQQEFELLQLMLSHRPEKRPTTYGIRARPPLNQHTKNLNEDDQWHFDLPPLRRDSNKTSSISSSSTESWEQV